MEYNWENKIILVVEDVEINYVLIERILRKTKAKLFWVKNGQECIDFVESNPTIDVILMDVRMPVMDGIKATKIVKEIRPDISVIIQTACVIGSDFEEIEATGCNDYIFKPIISSLLYEKINHQLFPNNEF